MPCCVSPTTETCVSRSAAATAASPPALLFLRQRITMNTTAATMAMAATLAPTPTPTTAPLESTGAGSDETLKAMAQARLTMAEVGRDEWVGLAARPRVMGGGVAEPARELKQGVW